MAMKKEELQAAYDKLKGEMEEWKEEAEELSKHCSECEEENAELRETITCLESDSHNEVSLAEFDAMKQDYEEQIAELKENSPKPSVIKELEAQVTALKQEVVKTDNQWSQWADKLFCSGGSN